MLSRVFDGIEAKAALVQEYFRNFWWIKNSYHLAFFMKISLRENGLYLPETFKHIYLGGKNCHCNLLSSSRLNNNLKTGLHLEILLCFVTHMNLVPIKALMWIALPYSHR